MVHVLKFYKSFNYLSFISNWLIWDWFANTGVCGYNFVGKCTQIITPPLSITTKSIQIICIKNIRVKINQNSKMKKTMTYYIQYVDLVSLAY